MLIKIYQTLLDHFGPQHWWPIKTDHGPWEVCIGAILTQNTAWSNVEKALDNLRAADCLAFVKIRKIHADKLAELIRPSGFYKQKAERLKLFANFVFEEFGSVGDFCNQVTREHLLDLKGIGPETADSILLYACEKPYFVVDAYTRRIFSRLGLIKTEEYEKIRSFFEASLPKDLELYKEYHALVVRLAKENCRKRPICENCALVRKCKNSY